MYLRYTFHSISICALLFLSSNTNTATLFVTNLLDNGSPGSLRITIAAASSGDTIKFNVAGTITLDEFLDTLIIDKQLTIDGQNKITIDGADQFNICFNITGASASNSVIQNITIQNFNGHEVHPGSGTALQELPAYGIFIDTSATGCSVRNTTITHINSGLNQEAAGIKSEEEAQDMINNTIEFISSEDNPGGNSGQTYGIFIDNTLSGDCSDNTIHTISSGDASGSTGGFQGIIGIFINGLLQGDCLHNTVYNLRSGNAGSSSGQVWGIAFDNGTGTNDCSFNTVYNLSSGAAITSSGTMFGISTSLINNCTHNTVYNLVTGVSNNTGQATGIAGSLTNGDLSHNTIYNIHSEAASNDSGALFGMIFAGNIEGNCSHNAVYDISNGSAGNNSDRVFGMRLRTIVLNFSHNAICNISSGNAGNNSGGVFGMDATSVEESCFKNTVCNISSGSAGNNSGDVIGIETSTINGNCFNNTVTQLTTGNALQSGTDSIELNALGIFFRTLNAPFFNNVVTDISVTNSDSVDQAGGILFSTVADDILIACNTVRTINVNSTQSEATFGIKIDEGDRLVIRNNTIDSIQDNNSPAHGVLLGSDTENTFFTNSLVSFNSISTIIGNNLTGFGITILGIGTGGSSTGNDLLNNSIFNINGKAINSIDNGVPVDGTVTLQSVVCGAQTLFVRGTLEPDSNFEESEFLLQFFASTKGSPPQTMTFVGETTIQADDTTPFIVEIKSCKPINSDQYITATATALPPGTEQNNNTSEVSNAIPGCNNQTICNLATTTCNLEPPACPIPIAQ